MPLNGNSSGRRPGRGWVTALVILAAVIVLAAFVSRRDDAVLVRTAVVEQSKIRSLVSTNGKIEPANNFEAHAPVSTSVKRVFVKEGESVKKGQLLVVLDDADARAQAARAQTQLRAAWARASASSRTTSNCPFLTDSPSLTKTRFTLVETGAWASKLLTGSIFPFVETRLRILLCSTTAVRTSTASSRRETKAASTMTAARITSAVTHQRRGRRPELFPFNGMQRKPQASMYHPRAAGSSKCILRT